MKFTLVAGALASCMIAAVVFAVTANAAPAAETTQAASVAQPIAFAMPAQTVMGDMF